MNTQVVVLQTSSGPMNLYLTYPVGSFDAETSTGNAILKKKIPAILVFQEAFGINAHIKDVCARLAAEGYIAAAPELFHRSGESVEFPYDAFKEALPTFAALKEEHLLEDARVSYNYLHALPFVSSVSAIGFCMGGYTAILAAQNIPLKTAISFYGGGMVHPRAGIGFGPIIQNFAKIKCPVLLVFGERDGSILPDEVRMIRSALDSSDRTDFEIRVYPGAGHGFFCNDRSAYKEESAKEAWKKVLEWLQKVQSTI